MIVSGVRDKGQGVRVRAIVATAFLLFTIYTDAAIAQPLPPELTQPINDFANVIDEASESALTRRILALKQATGDVVVVATIDTFAPYGDIREYAVKMFENRGRGIGDKGKDNGLLVLIAVKDRKERVEVGYDLEQFVNDAYAGEVIRTVMTPFFVRGEYGLGLLAGVTQLMARIAQGRGVTISELPQVPLERDSGSGFALSPGLIILMIIVFIMISNMGNRSRFRGGRRRWGGGPWSGWNSGVGPFGGGGGFGGGGFGGGFGGFGGGRSGGGGASGGW
jgi:uncharacterized protein